MGKAFAAFSATEVLLIADGDAFFEHHIPMFDFAFKHFMAQILIVDADSEFGKLQIPFQHSRRS